MRILNLIVVLLLCLSCGEDEVDTTPPATPTNINVDATNFPELEVTWDNSTDANDINYKIYASDLCGLSETSNNVYWDCYTPLNYEDYLVGETTTNVFYINDLESFKGYAVYVRAVDAYDNESEVSVGRIVRTIPSGTVTRDISISDQVQIDFFLGHQIEVLNGNINIVGMFGSQYSYFNYSITDLSPLNGLREINGNLNVGGFDDNYNFNFENLSGFESLIRIDGDVIFYGSSGLSTAYIQDFFSTIEIGGELLIQ